MSFTVTIESVGPAFAPLLAQLHAECFAKNAQWDSTVFETLLLLDGVRAWCAMRAGTPVGFILVRTCLDESEILTFCVRQAYRRRRVGGTLLDFVLNTLREASVRKVFLEVSTNNVAALQLYKRKAFQVGGLRKNYYPDGRDAFLLFNELLTS